MEKKNLKLVLTGIFIGLLAGTASGYFVVKQDLQGEIRTLQVRVRDLSKEMEGRDYQIQELEEYIEVLERRILVDWVLIKNFRGWENLTTDSFYIEGGHLKIRWMWESYEPYKSFGFILFIETEGGGGAIKSFPDLPKEGTAYRFDAPPGFYHLEVVCPPLFEWWIGIWIYEEGYYPG